MCVVSIRYTRLSSGGYYCRGEAAKRGSNEGEERDTPTKHVRVIDCMKTCRPIPSPLFLLLHTSQKRIMNTFSRRLPSLLRASATAAPKAAPLRAPLARGFASEVPGSGGVSFGLSEDQEALQGEAAWRK